jgi:uncharacterized membrane protein YdjX (TVP38/TMEM64 family)
MIHAEKRTVVPTFAMVLILVGAVYVIWKYDSVGWLTFILNEKTHPVLFVGLMAVLPAVGFPISIFLVLAGIKFGLLWGLVVTAATLPIHMAASFFIANSMLRPRLEAFLRNRDYGLPQFPEDKMALFTCVFLGIPGLPYALKNYLLALAGVLPQYYFGIGWPVHLAVAVPFIGLGGSVAELNLRLSVLFVGILLAVYGLTTWLRKRYT